MKLQARVIDTHSASQYTDKLRRVTFKVDEADCMNTRLTVRSDDLREDEALTILVLTDAERSDLRTDLINLIECARRVEPPITNAQVAFLLADQLRPDAPPPWESGLINDADAYQQRYEAMSQPDEAQTQEFELETPQSEYVRSLHDVERGGVV